MSSMKVLNQEFLEKLVGPFAPGMSKHMSLIKYEVITPDMLALLFRTVGNDSSDHYFVSVESDYFGTIDNAKKIIEDWHGKVIRFWPLQGSTETTTIEHISIEVEGCYSAVLAEVERPVGDGYWASSVTIRPGDTVEPLIKHFTKKQQTDIRKQLKKILKHSSNPTAGGSFLKSYQLRYTDVIVDDINKSDMAVTIYVHKNGSIECFYNWVKAPN